MSDLSLNPFESASAGNRRLLHAGVLFFLGFSVLVGSLMRLQWLERDDLKARESYQTYRRVIREGPRGNIYDRNGVLLAGNRPLYSVGIYLNELRGEFRQRFRELQRDERSNNEADVKVRSLSWLARKQVMREKMDEVASLIGRDLVFNETSFEQHFLRRLVLPYPVVSNLSPDEYARLIENLPPGGPIQIFTEPIRHYPFGNVASHTIGYVGEGNQEDIELPSDRFGDIRTLSMRRRSGRAGLEHSLDAQLRGGIGWEVLSIDPLGFQYERVETVDPAPGSDLHTTLDIDVQLVGEAALHGKVGALAAILVETGEILALVSQPDYDLNLFHPVLRTEVFETINTRKAWLNRATQGVYPPGSTFKVVTALAALSEPDMDPMKEIYCGPFLMVGDRRFPENRSRGHGFIDMVNALAKSSNVYFYQAAMQVGIEKIARQARLLGLGARTGVELPFESNHSLVPDREWKRGSGRGPWLQGDTANVSIGQGDLLVTPLQMARLTAAVASRREFLPVTLLRDKNTALFRPRPLPIPDQRFEYVKRGMAQCVINGTGTSMRSQKTTIGAKTGTAQVFPGGKEENLAWVIAYAPIERPRIAVAVVVENVGSSDPVYGGSTAGPVARQVIEEFMGKYGF
jgi:penicillin-binding protein 2